MGFTARLKAELRTGGKAVLGTVLLLSEGGHWVEAGRSASGNQACQESGQAEGGGDTGEYGRVEGTDSIDQSGQQAG